ncbi:MAG TPA: TIGR04283 family arsenosugar biosynthesis glycosyltransferase [Candidatus Binatia bacterium]
MRLSVIVPALDEADEIEATLRRARAPQVVELLVVDGGSTDDTVARARPLADDVLIAPRGRALQMNAGARRACGDVLLFLHADTWLPEGFAEAVERAIAEGAIAGRFDVELRGTHPFLPVIATLMNARSRWTGISTGDQAIFVRRDVFARLGGFAPIPLMEDVELGTRLRRAGRLAPLRERVSTSARRWEEEGVARTIVLMWWLRFAYACGASPEWCARAYRRRRKR